MPKMKGGVYIMSKDKQPLTMVKIGIASRRGSNGAVVEGSIRLLERIGYSVQQTASVGRETSNPRFRIPMDEFALPVESAGAETELEVYVQSASQVLKRVEDGELTAAIIAPGSLTQTTLRSAELQLPAAGDSTTRAMIVTGKGVNAEVLMAKNFACLVTTEEKFLIRLSVASRRLAADLSEFRAGRNFQSVGEGIYPGWRYA